MKKVLSLTLSILLLLSLTACSGGDKEDCYPPPPTDIEQTYLELKESDDPAAAEELKKYVFVPVRFCTETDRMSYEDVYTYDEKGYLIKDVNTRVESSVTTVSVIEYAYDRNFLRESRVYIDQDDYSSVITYDKRGNVLSKVTWKKGKIDTITRNTYNQQGKPLELKEEGGDYPSQHVYSYDTAGRILTHYYELPTYTCNITYTYAEDGSYVENETYLRSDTDSGETVEYHYDSEGRIISKERSLSDGIVTEREEYAYDDKGNKVTYRWIQYDEVRVTDYEYNDAGLLIKEETRYAEKDEPEEIVKYTYTEDGKQTLREYTWDGTKWGKEEHVYDEQGRLIHVMHKDPWGDLSDETKYSFNEDGTLKSLMKYENSEQTVSTYEYDEWGNCIRRDEQNIDSATTDIDTDTARWQLVYCPDGVPKDVQELIDTINKRWEQ